MDTSAGAGVDSRDHDVDMHDGVSDDVGAGGGVPHGADEPPMSGAAGANTHTCTGHGGGATGRGSGAGHGTREHPPGAGAATHQSVQLGKQAVLKFLASKSCYEMLADSSKIVVFEREVSLRLAFFAMAEHDIKAAPVWDGDREAYCGVLTMSDYMFVMFHYFQLGNPGAAMSEHSCLSWRDAISPDLPVPGLQSVSPEQSLLDALRTLYLHHVGGVPVLDAPSKNVLSFLTCHAVFHYLASTFREDPGPLFAEPVRALGLGVFDPAVCVTDSTPLAEVFHKLLAEHLPAVPIVNSQGKVVDVFHRGETSHLVRDPTLSKLALPVGEVRQAQARDGAPFFEVLHTCPADSTLQHVFDCFAVLKGRTLTLVDSDGGFVGFIHLRLLFRFFVMTDIVGGTVEPLDGEDLDETMAVKPGDSVGAGGGAGAGGTGAGAVAGSTSAAVNGHTDAAGAADGGTSASIAPTMNRGGAPDSGTEASSAPARVARVDSDHDMQA